MISIENKIKAGAKIYESFFSLDIIISVYFLTLTHAAPNPVIFYAAISNFLVLRVRAE